jgi:hypothetical protein
MGKRVIREHQVFRSMTLARNTFPTLLLDLSKHSWRVVGCVDWKKSVRKPRLDTSWIVISETSTVVVNSGILGQGEEQALSDLYWPSFTARCFQVLWVNVLRQLSVKAPLTIPQKHNPSGILPQSSRPFIPYKNSKWIFCQLLRKTLLPAGGRSRVLDIPHFPPRVPSASWPLCR